jgi:hypothetical protein
VEEFGGRRADIEVMICKQKQADTSAGCAPALRSRNLHTPIIYAVDLDVLVHTFGREWNVVQE